MNMAWSRKSEKSKDHRNTEQEYHTVVIYRYSDYIVNLIYIYIYITNILLIHSSYTSETVIIFRYIKLISIGVKL